MLPLPLTLDVVTPLPDGFPLVPLQRAAPQGLVHDAGDRKRSFFDRKGLFFAVNVTI